MTVSFTERGTPLAESDTLTLVQTAGMVKDRISEVAAARLRDRGYEDVSAALLGFLGALDCGVNFGSDIARRLNISRQMVAKTVKELSEAGYLIQGTGPGKLKPIEFTLKGEKLMSEVRQILAEMDRELNKTAGKKNLKDLVRELDALTGTLVNL